MKTETTELSPVNGRKSFNQKAHLVAQAGRRFLRSYNTIVAGFFGGKVRRYWGGRSGTTSAHLAAFFDVCGVCMTPAQFYALPVSKCPAGIY